MINMNNLALTYSESILDSGFSEIKNLQTLGKKGGKKPQPKKPQPKNPVGQKITFIACVNFKYKLMSQYFIWFSTSQFFGLSYRKACSRMAPGALGMLLRVLPVTTRQDRTGLRDTGGCNLVAQALLLTAQKKDDKSSSQNSSLPPSPPLGLL